MKQSVLIASVLGGGVALGVAGVAGYQALTRPTTEPVRILQASQPAVAAQQAASAPSPSASTPLAAAPGTAVRAASAPSTPATQATAPKPANFAKVLSATPITETVQSTTTECQQVAVQRQAPVQDQNRLTGTLLGGVVGGLLGNQVGGGNGKKLATVVGAVAGGYAGNQAQDQMQKRDTYTDSENRCMEVPVTRKKIVAYQVRYTLDGKTGTIRMSHKPGRRLPARNGEILVQP